MHDAHLNGVLQALVTNTPSIQGAAVIQGDGQLVAYHLPQNFDESRISATVTAMLPRGLDLAAALKCGKLEQLLLTGEIGHVLLREAGPQTMLCTLAGPAVQMDALLQATGNAASRISRMLSSISFTAPQTGARSPEALYAAAGFTEADQTLVTQIWPYIRTALPGIADRFYQVLSAEPQMAALLAGRVESLKRTHLTWLESLFSGDYGPDFIRRQEEIGKAHTRAGVTPVFFAASMAFLRSVFPPALHACMPGEESAKASTGAVLRLLTFCQQIVDEKYAQTLIRLDETLAKAK
ncbi:MAG: protoglobin domain-containing protein [Acidocella sp.]|nr:protoglobin domain-containing protein [Acidocella sp.]